jgi:hypothetical protein
VSELPDLERGYRRLLAWYPRSFRRDQEEEMLAVLMAGARPGQRHPGLLDTADLVTGALTVRLLRALRPRPQHRRWADGLAVFSLLAPVVVVVVAILEMAVPYHLPPGAQPNPFTPFLDRMLGWRPEVGGAVPARAYPARPVTVLTCPTCQRLLTWPFSSARRYCSPAGPCSTPSGRTARAS